MKAPPAPLRALVLALAALAIPACGGNREMEELRDYEAAIEDSMAEDARVSARLKDLRDDLLAANASAAEMAAFATSTAVPFYRRFQEVVARTPARAPRLARVHALLPPYVGHRLAYLASIEAFLAIDKGEGMERLRRAQAAWDAAVAELREKTGGQIGDPGVNDALARRSLFMKAKYEPFQTGQVPVEEVEAALRDEVIPRLQKVAERSRNNRTAEGGPGAVARWAVAELAFFQELASTLPIQASVKEQALASQKEWEAAGESREAFLTALKAYRDSLR